MESPQSQSIVSGRGKHELRDFVIHFLGEMKGVFKGRDEKVAFGCARVAFWFIHLRAVGKGEKEICSMLQLDKEFYDLSLELFEEREKVLTAIFMQMFLDNLERSNGLLPDDINLALINNKVSKTYRDLNL